MYSLIALAKSYVENIKRRVIMFDELFGGFFDFNGDSHTDFAEELMGYAIMEDMMSEEDSSDDFDSDSEDEW